MSFGSAENKYLDNLTPAMGAPFGLLFGLECGPWRWEWRGERGSGYMSGEGLEMDDVRGMDGHEGAPAPTGQWG